MSDNIQLIPADELQEGMLLDLEDDEYATMSPPDASEQDILYHQSTIASFEWEYCKLDAVVRETLTCVVVHCETVSFACPPKHMIKVAIGD